MDNTKPAAARSRSRAKGDTAPASKAGSTKKSTGKRTSRSPVKEESRKKAKVSAAAAKPAMKKKGTKKEASEEEEEQEEQDGEKATKKSTKEDKGVAVVYQAIVSHDDQFGEHDEVLGVYRNKADCAKVVRYHIERTYGISDVVEEYKVTKDKNGFVSVYAYGWEGESMTAFMREFKVQ